MRHLESHTHRDGAWVGVLVAMGWGEGQMGSWCLMGTEFQFCKVSSGDDYTTM